MIRPPGTHDDHPNADWYRYWDEIDHAAREGHGLDMFWDCGIVYVHITENGGDEHLAFHPCQPRWVATWTWDAPPRATVIADADPRLLPVADGPATDADATDVGQWITHVIRTIAGHRPTLSVDQTRDYAADGYTTFPDQ